MDDKDGIQMEHGSRTDRRQPTPRAGRKCIDDGVRPHCDDGVGGDDVQSDHAHSGHGGEVSEPKAELDWQCTMNLQLQDHCRPNGAKKLQQRKVLRQQHREVRPMKEGSSLANTLVKNFRLKMTYDRNEKM